MPVYSYIEKDIESAMKLAYQTGYKLAIFTFSKEEIFLEKTCKTCGKIYFHENKDSRWCQDCVQKMLKDLESKS